MSNRIKGVVDKMAQNKAEAEKQYYEFQSDFHGWNLLKQFLRPVELLYYNIKLFCKDNN